MPDLESLAVASIAFGFTIGFGVLTSWEAAKQTMGARRPLTSVYIWLVWGEIFACFSLGLIVYLMLIGRLKPSVVVFVWIVILWAGKVNFVIQIIVNRINLIVTDRRWNNTLKWGCVAIMQVLVVLGFFWIPAQLGIEPWPRINRVVERIIKVSYFILDAALNYLFVVRVKRCLVEQGSKKYDKLVRFNIRIIFVSLAMDVLIMGAMSMPNRLVYTQMHPLGFMVKLRIELAMAKLIRKIAAQRNDMSTDTFGLSLATHRGGGQVTNIAQRGGAPNPPANKGEIMVNTTVLVDREPKSDSGAQSDMSKPEDVQPLRESWQNLP